LTDQLLGNTPAMPTLLRDIESPTKSINVMSVKVTRLANLTVISIFEQASSSKT
jgi:hypothetical protein